MAGRTKGKWSRRSQDEWRALMARFDSSGLGVAAFCRREAVSSASFYRWRGLLRERHEDAEAIRNDRGAAFVDLGELNSNPSPRPRFELKLDLGEGLFLHVVRG